MAASLLFDVYGPSEVPIKSNFKPATLKTQAVTYFRFAVPLLQNGRLQLRWLSVGSKNLVLMKKDASDAEIPVGLLLPIWHPPSWKMSASGFLKAPGPLEVRPIFNSKLQSSLPSYHA
jgi:hypothetical protein